MKSFVVLGAILACLPAGAQTQAKSEPLGPANGWLGDAVAIKTLTAEERQTGDGRVRALEEISLESLRVFAGSGDEKAILLRIENGSSPAMRLHLEDFHLEPGAQLFVYGLNENGEVVGVQGPYTAAGPLNHGEFWTPAIGGTAVILELQTPDDIATLPFELKQVALTDMADDRLDPAAPVMTETRTSVFRGSVVDHHVVDGMAIWEGDIILGRVEEMERFTGDRKDFERSAGSLSGTSYKWAGGKMPYTIDPAMPNQSRITAAVDHWNTNLNGYVKLVPRTTEAYYVKFVVAGDSTCSSYLGMTQQAAQPINIGAYCSTGNVIHEIGHAFGLYHEHTRSDRDSYVKINTSNVDPAAAYNFQKQASTNWGAYDYASIMHYPAYAFSINGQPTIETIPAGISIGQRSALSTGDIAGIKGMYPATTTPPPTSNVTVSFATNPAGRPLTVDNVSLATPGSAQWAPRSTHTISAPNATVSGVRYTFSQWSDGGAQTHSVTGPTAATTFTATYYQAYQLITTATTGGRVAASPSTSDGYYPANSTVTLTATADPNYCLASWGGVAPVASYSIAVGLTRPATISANFQRGIVSGPLAATTTRAGGLITLNVSATSGCIWRAYSGSSWITIEGASTGTAAGTLKLRIAASSSRRTGVVYLNSQQISIAQQ